MRAPLRRLDEIPLWFRGLAVAGWLALAFLTTWISTQHGWWHFDLDHPRRLPYLTIATALIYFPLITALWLWLPSRRR